MYGGNREIGSTTFTLISLIPSFNSYFSKSFESISFLCLSILSFILNFAGIFHGDYLTSAFYGFFYILSPVVEVVGFGLDNLGVVVWIGSVVVMMFPTPLFKNSYLNSSKLR